MGGCLRAGEPPRKPPVVVCWAAKKAGTCYLKEEQALPIKTGTTGFWLGPMTMPWRNGARS